MNTRIYLRASTKDQDAERALAELNALNNSLELGKPIIYVEHYSGTKLERPELNKLLQEANQGDALLVESVDRLSRLTQHDFNELNVNGNLKLTPFTLKQQSKIDPFDDLLRLNLWLNSYSLFIF